MAKPKELYDEDFVRWTEEQATALRRAKSLPPAGTRGSNLLLDWENRAEEIESLGKSDRAAARLAADDLTHHGEPMEAVWARLEGGEYTEEQVLGDCFPNDPG